MSAKYCLGCDANLLPSYKFCLCSDCFHMRRNDVCEIIDEKGVIYITNRNLNQLKEYVANNPALVRLDLHGVLDTIDYEVTIPNHEQICCISFVGSTSTRRFSARQDIQDRLGTQVKCGFLVFSRGGNKYHNTGGKAWLNSIIPFDNEKQALFIDDSFDHCESTKSMKIPYLDVRHYRKDKNLIDIINSYTEQ